MTRAYVSQADLAEATKDLIKNKVIEPESAEVAHFCLSLLVFGADRRKLKATVDCQKFNEYWNNLSKNGYIEKGTKHLALDKDFFETDIPFCLMIACAKGYLERKFVEDEKVVDTHCPQCGMPQS